MTEPQVSHVCCTWFSVDVSRKLPVHQLSPTCCLLCLIGQPVLYRANKAIGDLWFFWWGSQAFALAVTWLNWVSLPPWATSMLKLRGQRRFWLMVKHFSSNDNLKNIIYSNKNGKCTLLKLIGLVCVVILRLWHTKKSLNFFNKFYFYFNVILIRYYFNSHSNWVSFEYLAH